MSSTIFKSRYFYLVILLATTQLFSCEETAEEVAITDQVISFDCTKFSYEEDIFFLQEGSSDYIINPVNTLEGAFSSFPDDLEIDPQTG